MALRPGTLTVGPANGSLQLHTAREGVAQKAGHDLLITVAGWEATVDVDDGGAITAVSLDADARSLQIVAGVNGLKPLSDKDRAEIRRNIDAKVLRGLPITFRSDSVEQTGERLTVSGQLTVAGRSQPSRFELVLGADGHATGTFTLTQSAFAIKPYSALMGALKVRDAVEVVLDVTLPTAG